MNGLDIKVASVHERPIFDNLLQLYVHDFSQFHSGTQRCDLSADGRYAVDIPIQLWWEQANRVPLLIRYGGRLAGFALLNRESHGDDIIDHAVAEFFIVRKYRRMGLGMASATEIFSRWPGQWEVAIMRRNSDARQFWQRVIYHHPAVRDIVEHDSHSPAWDGWLFRFAIGPD